MKSGGEQKKKGKMKKKRKKINRRKKIENVRVFFMFTLDLLEFERKERVENKRRTKGGGGREGLDWVFQREERECKLGWVRSHREWTK